jgi:hypothetical protein
MISGLAIRVAEYAGSRMSITSTVVHRAETRFMLQRRSSVVAGFLSKLVIVSNRLTPRFVQGLIMQKALSG